MNIEEKWVMPSLKNVLPLFPFQNSGTEYIFEAELGTHRPQVDFSMCFVKSEADRLLTHWRATGFTQKNVGNSLWRRLRQFISLWREKGTALNTNIADIWFEFDHHQLEKELPEPCLFFSPRGLAQLPGKNSKKINASWLFETALGLLAGKSLPDKVKENISLCLESLPGKGCIFQVGLMLARNNPEPSVRLCTSLPIHFYTQFLEAIGWTGSLSDLKKCLMTLARYVDTVFIDIDIGEGIRTPIGLECIFQETEDSENRIREFLSYLTLQQLSTHENAELVQAWIRDNSTPVFFDCILEEEEIRRSLSHLKMVFTGEKLVKVKSYLSLSSKSK